MVETQSSHHRHPDHLNITCTEDALDVTMLTLRAPSTLPSPSALMWENHRSVGVERRGRESERIELPSIRQAVPEILRQRQPPAGPARHHEQSITALPGSVAAMPSEPLQENHLPKRRRLSDDEDARERPFQRPRAEGAILNSPRLQTSPRSTNISQSPGLIEPWPRTTGNASLSALPAISTHPLVARTPPTDRLTLPSLPSLTLGRSASPPARRSGWPDYVPESHHHTGGQLYPPTTSVHHPHANSYAHSRVQHHPSYSHPPYHVSHERTPFTINHAHYGHHYPYGMDLDDMSDTKQRKRRGNLPKETTDKLRAWFVAHLQHPYPTEDEKQDLMMRTGLQMNQISNWFINARRRQLPAMINNARAESDARSGRGGSGSEKSTVVIQSPKSNRISPGRDSDYGGSPDDEIERRRPSHWARRPSRESI